MQAAKAGLLEIADVFAVNKADRPGADSTVRDLLQMLELGGHRPWMPPIVEVVATEGRGVDELWDAIAGHRDHSEADGLRQQRREQRLREEIKTIVTERLTRRAEAACGGGDFDALVARVMARELDPHTAAAEILAAAERTS